MENLGWTVAKWTNTLDYDKEGKTGKIVPAKRKYNPFLKALSVGTGFPDFICFKKNKKIVSKNMDQYETINGAIIIPCSVEDDNNYEVIGLEVKGNGYLDPVEKGMCIWLLENKIFSRILIAKKSKEGRGTGIEYIDFNVKYNNK